MHNKNTIISHGSHARDMSVDQMLLQNRVVFLAGPINQSSAINVIMRLLYLQSQKPGIEINLYISSPGGHVDDTLAIIDTMNHISSPVSTCCIGQASSGGALVLASGQKGKRYCLPHAKVMIHQPLGGVSGQTTDIMIQAQQIVKTKKQLNQMLASLTGQEVAKITKDVQRDKFFSALQAKQYGIIDQVVKPKNKQQNKKTH